MIADRFRFMNLLRAKYGYHASVRLAKCFRLGARWRIRGSSNPRRASEVSCDFSLGLILGRALVPDAIRTLRSFVRYVGRPRQIRLASDGTLGPVEIRKLVRSANLQGIPILAAETDLSIFEAMGTAAKHPLIRKLAFLTSLPYIWDERCLYLDTDIEFFPEAHGWANELVTADQPLYMVDFARSLDGRLLRSEQEWEKPVNSGMIWFSRPLDWKAALDRLFALGADFVPTHFTEQTVVHLAMHQNDGLPLDPARFVVSLEDQFEWSDRFAHKPGVVCRHYVRPVRHKMWMLPMA